MKRRSLLSCLCTGALALLAPVVVWAREKRHDLPYGVVDARHYEALGKEHVRVVAVAAEYRDVCDARGMQIDSLIARAEAAEADWQVLIQETEGYRALLTEARDDIAFLNGYYGMKWGAGLERIMEIHNHSDLLARIDAALGKNG